MPDKNEFTLKGSEYFLTDDPLAAYRVDSGAALVYVVRITDGETGRRYLVTEAKKGSVIPALSFTDELSCPWRFCIACVGHARLTLIENGATRALKARFAKAAGVRHFEDEGFENGFSDLYEKNLAEEDAVLIKNARLAGGIKQSGEAAENGDNITEGLRGRGWLLYRAAEYYCKRIGAEIIPYEKLTAFFGEELTFGDIARTSHFSYKKIRTEEGWYRKDCGMLMVFRNDGAPAVCVPRDDSSYDVFLPESEKAERLTREFAENVSDIAVTICRPFPPKPLEKKDIIRFCARSVPLTDIIMAAIMSLAVISAGIIIPELVRTVFDDLLPLRGADSIITLCAAAVIFFIAEGMFSAVNRLSVFRIKNKITRDCQSAVFDRLFKLPEQFFDRYSSVDLTLRAVQAGGIIGGLFTGHILLILTAAACAVYLICCFYFSPEFGVLGILGTLMILIFVLLKLIVCGRNAAYSPELAGSGREAASELYEIVSGIEKIKAAGAEERALTQYIRLFKKYAGLKQKRSAAEALLPIIETFARYISAAVIFFAASRNGCPAGTLIGFFTAFSFLCTAAFRLTDVIFEIKQLWGAFHGIKPILDETPELNIAKTVPGDISGAIEINNVTFSYPDAPEAVLKNVSLDIKAGSYIGIAGASGSGKTTLMKLMLGSLRPNTGKIYYDGKDIDSLNKQELRKNFGIVMQDSCPISGSIYDNISVTAPYAARSEILEVSRLTGSHEFISNLPMGYDTVIDETSPALSGGQLQRILIARSLISRPRIIFLDEAASALDNGSQDKIREVWESMDATKIVISHRLSTMKNCTEIIVLDKGGIAERGSYAELIQKKGLFFRFAQQVEE